MDELHPDLERAVEDVLTRASDQSEEFKRRFRRLVANAVASNLADADVRDVIELATVFDEDDL